MPPPPPVHVHSGLDELCADHSAGAALAESLADLVERGLAEVADLQRAVTLQSDLNLNRQIHIGRCVSVGTDTSRDLRLEQGLYSSGHVLAIANGLAELAFIVSIVDGLLSRPIDQS